MNNGFNQNNGGNTFFPPDDNNGMNNFNQPNGMPGMDPNNGMNGFNQQPNMGGFDPNAGMNNGFNQGNMGMGGFDQGQMNNMNNFNQAPMNTFDQNPMNNGFNQNPMNVNNMYPNQGMATPTYQQPMQQNYGNGNNGGAPHKKGKKGVLLLAVIVIVVICIFAFSGKGNGGFTCTLSNETDDVKTTWKTVVKFDSDGYTSTVNHELKYDYKKLDDDTMMNLLGTLDIYGGGKMSPNYDKFNVKGTTKLGRSYLGDDTVVKRSGNKVTVTASTTDKSDDKITKEDIEGYKKDLESAGMTCK